MLKTFDQGLAKIMSKMGISVVDSYRGAHLFDSIGLDDDVIFRCLRGTPDCGITYRGVDSATSQPSLSAYCDGISQPVVVGYSDSDWAQSSKAK